MIFTNAYRPRNEFGSSRFRVVELFDDHTDNVRSAFGLVNRANCPKTTRYRTTSARGSRKKGAGRLPDTVKKKKTGNETRLFRQRRTFYDNNIENRSAVLVLRERIVYENPTTLAVVSCGLFPDRNTRHTPVIVSGGIVSYHR